MVDLLSFAIWLAGMLRAIVTGICAICVLIAFQATGKNPLIGGALLAAYILLPVAIEVMKTYRPTGVR